VWIKFSPVTSSAGCARYALHCAHGSLGQLTGGCSKGCAAVPGVQQQDVMRVLWPLAYRLCIDGREALCCAACKRGGQAAQHDADYRLHRGFCGA